MRSRERTHGGVPARGRCLAVPTRRTRGHGARDSMRALANDPPGARHAGIGAWRSFAPAEQTGIRVSQRRAQESNMNRDLAKSIGKAARQARKTLALTQEDAAERINVS